MARMILEPVKSLWNLCLFYLFLVKPEECPVCATLKKKRKKPHIVLHCPRCKLPAHTSGTNGRNPVLNCPKHGRLSVMRSIEARCFFALCAVRVGQLVAAGLSQKKTAKLLGVTRTFVETVISTLTKHLPTPTPMLSGDLIVAFIDGFFSSRLAILVGKSGKNVLWAFGGENTVTINAFLKRLRKNVPEGATLVGDRREPLIRGPHKKHPPQSHSRETFSQNLEPGHSPLLSWEPGAFSLRSHRHASKKKHRPGNSLGGCADESPPNPGKPK